MLKKASSFVLASLKASTYGKEYASASRSLRPRWVAFLNILNGTLKSLWPSLIVLASKRQASFSTI
jgi:hypothetical protein